MFLGSSAVFLTGVLTLCRSESLLDVFLHLAADYDWTRRHFLMTTECVASLLAAVLGS